MTSNITVVLISHKSKNKVLQFIKNLSEKIKIIIIENSGDLTIKDELRKIKKEKVKLIFSENDGYGSGINLARQYVDTDYFIVFNPDINDIDDHILEQFIIHAKKLNDNFACIGPRYNNISSKTLKQSNEEKEIDILKSISGATMFFNKLKFDLLGGFDENFFLYFEETDYCFRAKEKGLKSYQINTIKVSHDVGTSTILTSEKEKIKLKHLHNWHFIWSKFYFFRKHYGFILSILYFTPIILRTLIKLIIYSILSKKKEKIKYLVRYDGLISSIKGLTAYKRINNF